MMPKFPRPEVVQDAFLLAVAPLFDHLSVEPEVLPVSSKHLLRWEWYVQPVPLLNPSTTQMNAQMSTTTITYRRWHRAATLHRMLNAV